MSDYDDDLDLQLPSVLIAGVVVWVAVGLIGIGGWIMSSRWWLTTIPAGFALGTATVVASCWSDGRRAADAQADIDDEFDRIVAH